jgi:glutamate--cysteine ligase
MESTFQTPHLTTASTKPLNVLEKEIVSRQQEIENWFQSQWKNTRAPVYGSVDLRNAGFKLAPVDMNLFPAGFNNLNRDFMPLSIEAAKVAITAFVPTAKKVLVIPESHTRNLFYWENIHTLLKILTEAGFTARIGTLMDEFKTPRELDLPSGKKVLIETLTREKNKIFLNHFCPDFIMLNNDLSEGIPDILQNLEQPLFPPAELGWSQRLKSGHFQYYAHVVDEFSKLIQIDPWFIAPFFRQCGEIDFMNRDSEDCLTTHVDELLTEIQKKYDEYEIACKPFLIVKADAGTYGMAVMTVRNADEMRNLNRKQRTHMSRSKGGQPVSKVIVQEGIYTFETWGPDNAVAEPVVYLWGERVVGGFYRVHQARGVDENLNSPGMKFEPLAFAKTCHQPAADPSPNECQNRFYAYGVIARLSMLAAAREIKEQTK